MKNEKVILGGQTFEIEIAESLMEKAKGLMNREYLHDNHGMLFVFPFESIYPFTMRNMKFPLDLIWIDRHENIVHISENVRPCRTLLCPPINPWKRAKYVLEINAGMSKKLGLKAGNKVHLPLKG